MSQLRHYRITGILFGVLAVTLTGCPDGGGTIAPPKLDPTAAAAAAIEQYDTNSDGMIDKAEAKTSVLDPAAGWDADGDKKISEDEIRERLDRYEKLSPGIQSMTCTVFYRGRPLADAEVVFEPEAFLGGAVEVGTGTTDIEGVAEMVAEEVVKNNPTHRGIRASLYKVRITHPEIDIPAKYNVETTLFFELSPMDMVDPPRFSLR